jgi:two-component system alkaline phosphatase synthesis response regulator PhoP
MEGADMALIYIVEDDPSIQEIEKMALKNSNYIVQVFERASSFLEKVNEIIPDLVLLDIMLPDKDGYEIVRRLRSNTRTRKIPVIMITAKTSEMDMVKGLDDGADDYIRKPFSVMELLSRVRALLRRFKEDTPMKLRVGDIALDNERHTVMIEDRNVVLTLKEYDLLRYLMMNEGIVLTREAIMRTVWDVDFEGETRTVDMHIKTLRQKLGEQGAQIKTIRGVGYSISKEYGEKA